jgi:oligoribonuclease (3'-5' exoribonuclease)
MALTRSAAPLVWIDCEVRISQPQHRETNLHNDPMLLTARYTCNKLTPISLQMTGLDPETDRILQICCFVTDAQLQLLEPSGFETIIHHPQSTLDAMSQWCIDTHGRSGLTSAVLASSTTASAAAAELLSYIKKFVPEPRTALLAGNSVHADRAFLSKGPYAPVLEWLHYRILDVSTIKEAVRRWGSEELLKDVPPKRERHLAKDDILESIEEMRYYRNRLFGGK